MFADVTTLAQFEQQIDGPGRNTIVRAERMGLVIFDYAVSAPDTFSNAFRRECRGITFDLASGKLISRPYHKFFNLNEREETHEATVDFGSRHFVLDKLDGSMIHAFWHNDEFTAFTRLGPSEQAMQAKRIIDATDTRGHALRGLIKYCEVCQLTPLFEFVSPKYRIVLKYKSEDLVLTGLRSRVDGSYVDYLDMKLIAQEFGVPVVKAFPRVSDLRTFVETSRGLVDAEGYVVRFDTGLHLKVKGDWYTGLHRVKFDIVSHEPSLLSLVLQGKIDDVKAALDDPDDRAEVESIEKDFWTRIDRKAAWLQSVYDEVALPVGGDKARFAKEVAPTITDKQLLSMLFEMVGRGKTAYEVIYGVVRRNVITDEMRGSIAGSVTWDNFKNSFLG